MKRGMEAHAYVTEKEIKLDLSPWVIAMLVVTLLGFMYLTFMIEYTFGRVIPTLIMVESPQDSITFQAIPTEDNDMIKSPEPVNSGPHYITSNFRSSIKLLKAHGGYRGRFRGIGMYIANGMAINWIAGIMSAVTGGPSVVCIPVAAVICAQLSLGWTLTVIGETRPQFWFRRIPSVNAWKKIAGPTAAYAAVQQLATLGPLYLLIASGMTQDPKEISKLPLDVQQIMALKAIGAAVLSLILVLGLVLPGKVILTRMQASLIDESEETIVPFDRTFGGKVVPEIVGGSGMIGAMDAWKTFDRPAFTRLIKAYAKCFAMVIATSFLFIGVLVAECAIFAPNLHKAFLPADGN